MTKKSLECEIPDCEITFERQWDRFNSENAEEIDRSEALKGSFEVAARRGRGNIDALQPRVKSARQSPKGRASSSSKDPLLFNSDRFCEIMNW